AAFLVSCLENERVRFAFGIPGEENLELMDSLRDSSIRFVLTRHEGAAAFMADVLGRLTTHARVCLATLGPAATNLVTGVADAFLDRAPLVAITAQANLSRVHRESHQFVDILRLFAPITKWNARVESPDTVPEIVRKALKLAEAEKAGSTHIELPEDVAEEETSTNPKPLPVERIRNPSPDRSSLERAAAVIRKADRPVVLAGAGVIRSGASDELLRFAEGLGIPVAHTFMGKGSMPWTSPMSLLTIGVLPGDYDLAGFNESDLVICVGAHKLWLGRFFRTIKPNTVVISNGLSAMGIALPGGIAAKLADPDRRVVTVSGDGGFLMSVHELETAKREKTATVNLVLRDGGLGSIRWKQMARFGRTEGTEFGNPDLVALAAAFGIRGLRVERPSDLNSVVTEALESTGPIVVDVPVDYGDNPFLAPGT